MRLVHPAALLACGRPQLAERLPKAKRAIGDGEFGSDRQTSVLQIEQQFTPILRAFARTVGKAEQLLFALRRRADDHQDALFGVVPPAVFRTPDFTLRSDGRRLKLLLLKL